MDVALLFFGLLVLLVAAAVVFAIWKGTRSWLFRDMGAVYRHKDSTNTGMRLGPPDL